MKPSLLLLPLALLPAHAETRFDFGNGSVDGNTGVAANVVVAENAALSTINATVDGIQISITGVAVQAGSLWGSNSQGIGVHTSGQSGTTSRRISGSLGESVEFLFSHDVTIDSIRLGAHSAGEVTAIQFVSGTDPYGGGAPWSYTSSGSEGPTDDITVGVSAQAGTTMRLTTTVVGAGGVLWNDIVVTDPTAPPGDLVTSIAPSFPAPTLAENQNPGSNLGNTLVAAGNSKGQSFSLADDTSISGFAFEMNAITTTGNFTLEIYRAMDGLPWMLTPIFTDGGTLPAGLADGDLLQIDLDTPLEVVRGSYVVALKGLGATSFNLPFTNDPLFPAGDGVRNNPSTNGWQLLNNPDADLVFAVLGTRDTPAPPVDKPNIIFILADDLGWTDVRGNPTGPNVIGPENFGSDFYQTPNVARLAAEGLSFTNCHVHQNCAPTRAALLSGQYPARSGNGVYNVSSLNRGNGTPALVAPGQNEDVPASHITHAEALQSAGYVTAHFGKYHVGNHEGGSATMPENQGFEYNFGGKQNGAPGSYYASGQVFSSSVGPGLDAWAKDYTQDYLDTVLKGPASNPLHLRTANPNNPDLILSDFANSNHDDNKYLTDGMGDAAIAFLSDHHRGEMKGHPFFMQFHTYAVHTPIQARWDLRVKYRDSVPDGTYHSANQYAALVEAMDQTIGRIIDWLDDPNGDGNPADSVSGDTLLIFSSDNGGHIGDTDNHPLRHRKGSLWEGGLRVPLIIRRPGTVPAGQITDTLVHAVDFYPTILEHAGVAMPGGINFDGTSFARHMVDPSTNPRDRETIFYHFPGYLDNRARPCSVAIKRVAGKDYKLIHTYDLNYVGNNPQAKGLKVLSEPWELYNLTDDISETTDLIDGSYSNHLLYGVIADTMAAELLAWLTQPGGDWNARQPAYRSGGGTVPYPQGDVPDITVPFEQEFRTIGASVDDTANETTLTWNSEAGFNYDIEASDDTITWDPLQTGITATGSSTTRAVADPAIATSDRRFYRVVLRP